MLIDCLSHGRLKNALSGFVRHPLCNNLIPPPAVYPDEEGPEFGA
jgi:hypothetical protein